MLHIPEEGHDRTTSRSGVEIMRTRGDFEIKFKNLANVKVPIGIKRGAAKVALKILNDALEEEPKAPWKSGKLRNTASAFVNEKLVAVSERHYPFVKGARVDPRYKNARRLAKSPIKASKTTVQVSLVFNVGYAEFVHQMPGSFKFTYPGSGPGFLLSKLKKNQKRYMEMMKDSIVKAMT